MNIDLEKVQHMKKMCMISDLLAMVVMEKIQIQKSDEFA